MDRPFLDMDAVLVERFAKPIAAIFAEDGEPVFRAAESALCAELAEQSGLIISTGGGALVNPANRDALSATGTVICLTATVDEILARTDGDNDRPLMGADRAARRARLESLLAARADAYAAIPIQIDTTGKPPAGSSPKSLKRSHAVNTHFPLSPRNNHDPINQSTNQHSRHHPHRRLPHPHR